MIVSSATKGRALDSPALSDSDNPRLVEKLPRVTVYMRHMKGWLEAFLQDIHLGVRTLRKSPGFVVTAILTIGLGVGATTAVFSVVNGVLLRALPYPEADRVAVLWRLAPLSSSFGSEEYPWGKLDFSLFQQEQKVFSAVGACEPGSFNLTGVGEPVMIEGARTTAGFFPALGVAPAMGRVYGPDDDRPGHDHVVVLSDGLWRTRFSARADIVGRAIQLNGFSYDVVGVMPPGFAFPHGEEMPAILEFPRQADLWTPLAIAPGERGPNELAVLGRLQPGAKMSQVPAVLDVFSGTLLRVFPTAKGWTRTRAVPLRTQIVGPSARPLLLLLGAVGLVLLIVVSNIAGLVLTRALGRRREFDLRAALGAGRGRLMRQLLAENLLLAAMGGVLGVALGEIAIELVKKVGPANLPRLQEVSLDRAVLLFSVSVTAIGGLFCGLAPGFSAARRNLTDSLRASARTVAGQTSPNDAQRAVDGADRAGGRVDHRRGIARADFPGAAPHRARISDRSCADLRIIPAAG
jgi:predicted permease